MIQKVRGANVTNEKKKRKGKEGALKRLVSTKRQTPTEKNARRAKPKQGEERRKRLESQGRAQGQGRRSEPFRIIPAPTTSRASTAPRLGPKPERGLTVARQGDAPDRPHPKTASAPYPLSTNQTPLTNGKPKKERGEKIQGEGHPHSGPRRGGEREGQGKTKAKNKGKRKIKQKERKRNKRK